MTDDMFYPTLSSNGFYICDIRNIGNVHNMLESLICAIGRFGIISILVIFVKMVILRIMVILATFGFSIFILCCEIWHKRISDVMDTRNEMFD